MFASHVLYPVAFPNDLYHFSAGGVGIATCLRFGRLGATVVACDRDAERLAAFAETMARQDIPCFTRQMTIRDPEQVAGLMDAVWERYPDFRTGLAKVPCWSGSGFFSVTTKYPG